jgi:hypothetical protein
MSYHFREEREKLYPNPKEKKEGGKQKVKDLYYNSSLTDDQNWIALVENDPLTFQNNRNAFSSVQEAYRVHLIRQIATHAKERGGTVDNLTTQSYEELKRTYVKLFRSKK